MSEPRRLLEDEGELSPEERAALRAGARMRPPPGLDRAVRAELAALLVSGGAAAGAAANGGAAAGPAGSAAVGAAGVGGAAAGPAGSAAGAAAIAGKYLLLGIVGGAAIVGAIETTERWSSPAATSATASAPAADSASPRTASVRAADPGAAGPNEELPDAVPEEEPTSPTPRTAELRSARGGLDPSAGARFAQTAHDEVEAEGSREARTVRDEVERVLQARDALRRRDAAAALAVLQRAEAEFPEGVLGQEREVLSIEALAAVGRAAEAAPRARAYLSAHRDSPFVKRVERTLRAISSDGGASFGTQGGK